MNSITCMDGLAPPTHLDVFISSQNPYEVKTFLQGCDKKYGQRPRRGQVFLSSLLQRDALGLGCGCVVVGIEAEPAQKSKIPNVCVMKTFQQQKDLTLQM